MRSVEVSRRIDAPIEAVEAALTPETIILHEGTFSVADVEESEDGLVVTASATGITATFRFERLRTGYYYEQEGSEGPFETLETTVSFRPANGGVDLTMTSDVSLGVRPRAVLDRIAAWKRRGELRRALRSIANELE